MPLEVISYDKFASQICGEMQVEAKKEGHTLPFYNSQIVATTISNRMILVPRNTADFAPIKKIISSNRKLLYNVRRTCSTLIYLLEEIIEFYVYFF